MLKTGTRNFRKSDLPTGMNTRMKPQTISVHPTIFLNHLAGTLKPNSWLKGNTFAYFTNSFLWKKQNRERSLIKKSYRILTES